MIAIPPPLNHAGGRELKRIWPRGDRNAAATLEDGYAKLILKLPRLALTASSLLFAKLMLSPRAHRRAPPRQASSSSKFPVFLRGRITAGTPTAGTARALLCGVRVPARFGWGGPRGWRGWHHGGGPRFVARRSVALWFARAWRPRWAGPGMGRRSSQLVQHCTVSASGRRPACWTPPGPPRADPSREDRRPPGTAMRGPPTRGPPKSGPAHARATKRRTTNLMRSRASHWPPSKAGPERDNRTLRTPRPCQPSGSSQ